MTSATGMAMDSPTQKNKNRSDVRGTETFSHPAQDDQRLRAGAGTGSGIGTGLDLADLLDDTGLLPEAAGR
jgi:hypothetical protein